MDCTDERKISALSDHRKYLWPAAVMTGRISRTSSTNKELAEDLQNPHVSQQIFKKGYPGLQDAVV